MTASATDLAAAEPARRLDLRGEVCPTPTDATLRALDELAPGDVLEVQCDYYPARTTIPFHCDKRGYRYALSGDGRVWQIRIQKT